MMWDSIIELLAWVGVLMYAINTERRLAKLEYYNED